MRYLAFRDVDDGRKKVLIFRTKRDAIELTDEDYQIIRCPPTFSQYRDYIPESEQDSVLHFIKYAIARNMERGTIRLEGREWIISKPESDDMDIMEEIRKKRLGEDREYIDINEIRKEMAPDMTDTMRDYAPVIDQVIADFGVSSEYGIYEEDGHIYMCIPSSYTDPKKIDGYTYTTEGEFTVVQLDAVNKEAGCASAGSGGYSNARYSDKPKKSEVKKMMQDEFERMVGYRVSDNIYDEIEYVYMNCDQFKSKQDIVDFWKKHDYSGIHDLYVNCKKSKVEKDDMRQYV